MKIIEATDSNGTGVMLLRVDVYEAHRLIKSLAAQLVAKSPNVERWECFFDDGRDFSIAVHQEQP